MPDRCPRCNRKMTDLAIWRPVDLGSGDTSHVCIACAEEAELIDKAYSEACAHAKRIWIKDTSITITTIANNGDIDMYKVSIDIKSPPTSAEPT